MNILSIDHGKKRIGLAWADTDMGTVLPYGKLITQNSKLITELTDLIKNESIRKVVVGLPLGLDGKENENTKRVRQFKEELETKVDVPVELADERFTTVQAKRMGGDASLDEKSAMLILQSYLDKK
jgi:putative holliday junction resolvase